MECVREESRERRENEKESVVRGYESTRLCSPCHMHRSEGIRIKMRLCIGVCVGS